jgi:hypothetical protein
MQRAALAPAPGCLYSNIGKHLACSICLMILIESDYG